MAKPLREAVKAHFYPYAESRGFVRAKSAHPQFTIFRRIRGAKIHVFDIQWDKYGRQIFVVNFGEVESDGVSEAEVETSMCQRRYRLQRKRGGALSCWFQLRRPWIEAFTSGRLKYRPEEVVKQLIASFPEVEAWWEDKRQGPHIQCVLPLS